MVSLIRICPLYENCTSEQYEEYIKTLDYFIGPHYVVDFNGEVIELISPEYVANATGHRDIDYDSISIVVTGETKTEESEQQLALLIHELLERFPIISPLKYNKTICPTKDDYIKYGIYDKGVFPSLSR